MRKIAGFLAQLSLLTGFICGTSTHASEQLRNLDSGTNCQISYFHPGKQRYYTAGHCGDTGDRMRLPGGQVVRFVSMGNRGPSDWGYVDIKERSANIRVPRIWSRHAPRESEVVCINSHVAGLRCGRVLESHSNWFIADAGASGLPGDSGAPALNRKGKILGIYTGILIREMNVLSFFVRLPSSEQVTYLLSSSR